MKNKKNIDQLTLNFDVSCDSKSFIPQSLIDGASSRKNAKIIPLNPRKDVYDKILARLSK